MEVNLQSAITTINAGDRETGKKLLIEVLKADRTNENAWLWMTRVVDSNSERVKCLQNVLKINPNNEIAKKGLARLQQRQAEQPDQPKSPPEVPEAKPKSLKPLRTPAAMPATKPCPYCAETIKVQAKICRYCGRDLETGQPPQTGVSAQPPTPIIVQSPPQRQWSPGVAAVLSLVIPGAGQMYKGQVGKGLLHLLVIIIGYVFFIVPGLILHILCIIDAAQGNPYEDSDGRQAGQLSQPTMKAKQRSGSNMPLFLILGLVGFLVLVCVLLPAIGFIFSAALPVMEEIETGGRPDIESAPAQPETVSTVSGTTFTVPGIGFTTGRIPDGSVTMQSLTVWSGISRQQANCRLPHGAEVLLLNVSWVEEEWELGDGRYYFQIDGGGGCHGWITENFLSESYEEPTGELIP